MEEKKLPKVFSMVQDLSLNMDFIGRLGITQSDVYSHMVVELVVEFSAA